MRKWRSQITISKGNAPAEALNTVSNSQNKTDAVSATVTAVTSTNIATADAAKPLQDEPTDMSANTNLPGAIPISDITPYWLIEQLGFDNETFWNDASQRGMIDPLVAIENIVVPFAHDDFHYFLTEWDESYDQFHQGASFVGRMIVHQRTAINPVLGTGWFHNMFMCMGQLAGAVNIDLTSEHMLEHAVKCYWKRIKVLAGMEAAAALKRTKEAAVNEAPYEVPAPRALAC